VYICIYICVYVCIYTCVRACMCVCVYTCAYIGRSFFLPFPPTYAHPILLLQAGINVRKSKVTHHFTVPCLFTHPPPTGKCQLLESHFQVRFPGIGFHCQSARFFLLALIIILTLYSHGSPTHLLSSCRLASTCARAR